MTTAVSCRKWRQEQATKKEKRPKTDEQVYSETERRWVVTAPPKKPKSSAGINTLILFVILAALGVSAYLNRARIGALWQQVTGKAPPLWVMPEKPERDGPEIEGRDF